MAMSCFAEKKHLHIRGENATAEVATADCLETSPHTWRKPSKQISNTFTKRNISTYVEKTFHDGQDVALKAKHLHIRGENTEALTTHF